MSWFDVEIVFCIREDRTSRRMSIMRSRLFGVSRSADLSNVRIIRSDNLHAAFCATKGRDPRIRTYTPGIPVSVRARKWLDRRCRAGIRVGGESLKRVFLSRAAIKIRLIYGGRNTNVEHCWDYRRLNCHSLGRGTSHYAARRNKSGQLGAFLPASFFAASAVIARTRYRRWWCSDFSNLCFSQWYSRVNLPGYLFIKLETGNIFRKRDRMRIDDYSKPSLASPLAFRIFCSFTFLSVGERFTANFICDKISQSTIESN